MRCSSVPSTLKTATKVRTRADIELAIATGDRWSSRPSNVREG
jgi:hypothetical protein